MNKDGPCIISIKQQETSLHSLLHIYVHIHTNLEPTSNYLISDNGSWGDLESSAGHRRRRPISEHLPCMPSCRLKSRKRFDFCGFRCRRHHSQCTRRCLLSGRVTRGACRWRGRVTRCSNLESRHFIPWRSTVIYFEFQCWFCFLSCKDGRSFVE